MLSISIRTLRRIFSIFLPLGGVFLFLPSANGQRLTRADAYYLEFSLNALRQPVFCYKLDSAIGVPRCYAVDYDSLGRPTEVTRLFFGNLDSYSEWTIMKFRYDTLPRGSRLIRRTWHNPSGFPIPIGVAHGEDILYDSSGALLMITAIDSEAKRVEGVNGVTRMIYRRSPDGSYIQEWRYSNNKQFDGREHDHWGTQFAELDRNAWFRIFRADEKGYLTEEKLWSFAKKPISFPGGEMIRRYERNSCGLITSVRFFDLEEKPMADSSGIARIDHDYDSKHRLVGWRSFDIAGNPGGRKEFHGAASMTRAYREIDGALIRETLYDATGNEIKLPTEDSVQDSKKG